MTNYKHKRKLHELAMTLQHDEMNEKLGELGYVQQQKGGFWVEHRRYAQKEHNKRINRRSVKSNTVKVYTEERWARKNRLAVKSDILSRVMAMGINRAVCLPSAGIVNVVKTFKKFGVTNLHGFENDKSMFKTLKNALKKSDLSLGSIVMHEGDVLNYLNHFKGMGFFIEADFCGKITAYKKFFLNLPEYWSLTVCKARYGAKNKLIKDFGKYMGGKVRVGETTLVKRNKSAYEHTDLYIGKTHFHLYEYRDPNPKTNKCSGMFVITNI